MAEIDPIQYGRLLASVEQLTAQLRETSGKLASLDDRLGEVEGRFKIGKGTLIGLILAIGGSAWGAERGGLRRIREGLTWAYRYGSVAR